MCRKKRFNCCLCLVKKGLLCCFDRYSPVNNTWQKISNMRVPRRSCGVCLIGDRIYVVGGVCGNYEDKKTVEVYNPDRDEWTEVSCA